MRADDLPPDICAASAAPRPPAPRPAPSDGGRRRRHAARDAAGAAVRRHAARVQGRRPSAPILVQKLRENNWNISKTAEVIDTPRSNLYKKLEQYGNQAGDRRIGSRHPGVRLQPIRPVAWGPEPATMTLSQLARRSPLLETAARAAKCRRGRKVRTPKGSAPGNARAGQLDGQWHRKHTARRALRARRGKGEKVR